MGSIWIWRAASYWDRNCEWRVVNKINKSNVNLGNLIIKLPELEVNALMIIELIGACIV